MKKSIIASLLFIILTIPSFAQAWHTEPHYDAVECAICGKTVYVYREASYGPYIPSVTVGGPSGFLVCPGERAYTFYTLIKYICPDREHKYSKEYSEHIESFYVDRRTKCVELIEKYQEERRQKDIEERKNKIIELEKELDGLRK